MTAAAAIFLVAGFTSACGAVENLIPEENTFAQGSAKEIFAAAKADIESLESVHVSGSIRDEGQPGSFNISVSRTGDCEGSVTVNGIHFTLLVAEKRVFVRPDKSFFRALGMSPAQASQAVQHLGYRWFEDGSAKLGSLCHLESLFDVSDQGLGSLHKALPGKVTVTGESDFMGVPVVGLSATGPKGSYSMAVAVNEPHHVMSLTSVSTGRTDGGLTFSGHDVPVDTQVPAAADIVPGPPRLLPA